MPTVAHAVLTVLTLGIYNAWVDHRLRKEELKVIEMEIKLNTKIDNIARIVADLSAKMPPLPKDLQR